MNHATRMTIVDRITTTNKDLARLFDRRDRLSEELAQCERDIAVAEKTITDLKEDLDADA